MSEMLNSSKSLDGSFKDNMTNSFEQNVFDPFSSVLFNPWLSVLDIVQVLGCVLIIILICKSNKLKDIPSRFLMNSTIAEMCLGISFILLSIAMATGNRFFIEKSFFVQKCIYVLNRAEIMHTLTILLFMLHLAICHPFYYKIHCRTRYFLMFLLFSWTFNIIHTCCIFLVELRDMDDLSVVIWIYATRFYIPATIFFIIVSDVIPFIIIIVCYVKISRHCKQQTQDCTEQSTTRTFIHQAKIVFFLVFASLLTAFTSDVLDLVMVHLPDFELKDNLFLVKNVFQIISYLFVILNLPLLLYGFKSCRRVLRSMFNCCEGNTQRSCNIGTVEMGRYTSDFNRGTSYEVSGINTSGISN